MMEDITEQLRSDECIREALDVVKREIVKADFSNPLLFVQLPTIKDALDELIYLRAYNKVMKSAKKDVFVTNEKGEEIDTTHF